jgi:choline dehydrogenase-like flavoprotein
MADNVYDAIVIGSGISGGWAAKELTEKGLKTLLLERGRNVEHIKDYTDTTKSQWELKHRGNITTEDRLKSPIQSSCYAWNEVSKKFFVNDLENPYTSVKPFDWFRGYQVGGRSLIWGRQCYRWSDLDFGANAKDGHGVDWPIRYKEIAKWYDHVEKFVGISGSSENLAQLPDGQFLPPMDMTVLEKDVASRIKKRFNDERRLIIGRTANLTKHQHGRGPCQFRNKCAEGCPFGGYFSSQSGTLPAAAATGNLTIRPDSIVMKILYDKDSKRATGVEVLDAETNQTYQYKAKVIFLNASTLNSAWILMHSATDVWPEGLGSSSGQLGHNIMDHHAGVRASGTTEKFDDRYYYGRRPNGIYIPRYRNLNGEKRDYVRGFGYQGNSNRQGWTRNIDDVKIGTDLKEALADPGLWTMNLYAFGETLPYHENKVIINETVKDKWGLSTLSIEIECKDNELKMRKDMQDDAIEMLEAAGLDNVKGADVNKTLGRAIHEMGSARMGNDPKTSVVNKWNQVWDAPNLFVTDGSFMTSSACQNPSLTYMAFTARAVDYAADALKKGTL